MTSSTRVYIIYSREGKICYGYFSGELETVKEYIAISTNSFTGKLSITECSVKHIDLEDLDNLKTAKLNQKESQVSFDDLKVSAIKYKLGLFK